MARLFGKVISNSVFDIASRAKLQQVDLVSLETTNTKISDHIKEDNKLAHTVDNIAGLRPLLDGKSYTGHTHTSSEITDISNVLANKANKFTGFTGSFSVITSVNFEAKTVTSKTVNVSNGIIVSIS